MSHELKLQSTEKLARGNDSFIAALFTMSHWKQPRSPSVAERMNELVHLYKE